MHGARGHQELGPSHRFAITAWRYGANPHGPSVFSVELTNVPQLLRRVLHNWQSSTCLLCIPSTRWRSERAFSQVRHMLLVYRTLKLLLTPFAGMYSVAGAFAGLIAYGLLKLDTGRLHGWQVVFIVEGGFTVLLGGLSLVLLPRSLSTA